MYVSVSALLVLWISVNDEHRKNSKNTKVRALLDGGADPAVGLPCAGNVITQFLEEALRLFDRMGGAFREDKANEHIIATMSLFKERAPEAYKRALDLVFGAAVRMPLCAETALEYCLPWDCWYIETLLPTIGACFQKQGHASKDKSVLTKIGTWTDYRRSPASDSASWNR